MIFKWEQPWYRSEKKANFLEKQLIKTILIAET